MNNTESSLFYNLLVHQEENKIFSELEPHHFSSGKISELYKKAKELHAKGQFAATTLYDSSNTELVTEIYDSKFIPLKGDEVDAAIAFLKDEYVKYKLAMDISTMSSAEMKELINSSQVTHRKEVTAETFDEYLKLAIARNVSKIPFFSSALNRLVGGLTVGELVIIASRPSVGKSIFLEQTFWDATKLGKKCLFVSIEMSDDMIFKRAILRKTGTNLFKQNLGIKETQDLYQGVKEDIGLSVIATGDHGLVDIEELVKKHKPDILLIDYLQIMSHSNHRMSEYERVTANSQGLAQLKNKYKVAILCASQYSRAVNGQPELANLRSSGAIEQDADVVISLWKKPEEDLGGVRKIYTDCLKNRNGTTFCNSDFYSFALMLNPERVTFYDIEGVRRI